MLALVAAGCGSGEAEVEEVPGAPVNLTVPHQKGAQDLSEDGEASDDEDADADATPTPTADAEGDATPAPADDGTTGSTGATGTDTGGTDSSATPAPATEDSPTTDTQPPAGSAPEQFEQFCEENAGAC